MADNRDLKRKKQKQEIKQDAKDRQAARSHQKHKDKMEEIQVRSDAKVKARQAKTEGKRVTDAAMQKTVRHTATMGAISNSTREVANAAAANKASSLSAINQIISNTGESSGTSGQNTTGTYQVSPNYGSKG